MIIRSRRNNESLLRRVLRLPFGSHPSTGAAVVSANEFLVGLAKETARSNRRSMDREFALLLLGFSGSPDLKSSRGRRKLDKLAIDFQERLRITDIIGWYDGNLAVLLPETKLDGARNVSNDLARICLNHDLRVETDVLIYPWDDDVASSAGDLSLEGISGSPMSGECCDLKQPHEDGRSESAGKRYEADEIGSGEVEAEEELATAMQAVSGSERLSELEPAWVEPVTRMTAFARSEGTPVWKRAVDIVASGTGLILLSPVFLATAVAIKLSSPGPVFFSQRREGKDGQCFEILKFRTMGIDAEARQNDLRAKSEQDGPAFKLSNDPRVTTVGRYLRKSCIDELPQLINIIRGEMSVVGPRPLPVDESAECSRWQRHRLRVLPGLTCIWQLEGGRNVKFDEWMRMDMQYIERRSFLYDSKLIVKTALVALLHKGSV